MRMAGSKLGSARRVFSHLVLVTLLACGDAPVPTTPIEPDPPEEPTRPKPPNPIPSERVTFSGRVFTLDEDLPEGLIARAWTGIDTVEAAVDETGVFSLRVPKGALDSTVVVVGQALDGTDGVHPALEVFDEFTAEVAVRILLIPRAWTVERGTYEGQTVEVSLQTAIAPDNYGGDGTFYGVWPTPSRSDADPPLAFWTARWASFPVPVHLAAGGPEEGRVNRAFSAADSATVWRTIGLLEETAGMDLFEPVDPATITIDTISGSPVSIGGIRLRWLDPGEGPSDWAYVEVPCGPKIDLPPGIPPPPEEEECEEVGEGNIGWGVVSISSIWAPFAVQHEFLHALGFGHGCFHPSIMAHCVGPYPLQMMPADRSYDFEASPYDIAYFQLHSAIHERSREVEAHWGLVEGADGERRLLRGLGPIPASWWDGVVGR